MLMLMPPFFSFFLLPHISPLKLIPSRSLQSNSALMVAKERKERFSTLPFSVSCVSQFSVSVIENQPNKTLQNAPSFNPKGRVGGARDQSNPVRRRKGSSRFLKLQRPSITAGIHRLVKGFKSLSYLFIVYKYDEEEEEAEMEIGYPTDVQHVAHIGWEGFNTLGSIKNWDKTTDVFPVFPLVEATRTGHGFTGPAQL